MARLRFLALPSAIAFLLAGCADLFRFNLFKSMDKTPTPVASDYEGAKGLDRLSHDLASKAVVEALNHDQQARDEIAQILVNEYLQDGVSNATN